MNDEKLEPNNTEVIRIGVSSCLLGNMVRYNGGHQHDRYITETLANYWQLVPVCPEVECGLPVPREAMRLVGDPDNPRLLTSKTRADHTEQMLSWAKRRVKQLEDDNLCGFIFKGGSPSSGMERVKVYDDNNVPRSVGVGLFARAFKDHFPLIPTEEDGRLHDPILRENFIETVFVYRRWRTLAAAPTPDGLVRFHTRHKMLIRAHSEEHYRKLGKVAAQAGSLEMEEMLSTYRQILMTALQRKPTVNKHVNVLTHMLGYFKKLLSGEEKQELLELIERYREHSVPLIVPLTLFNHYIRKYNEPYLAEQHYLTPHPIELKLRNHC